MPRVFISYSRKDVDVARRLTGELQKSDMDCWIDWEDIEPTVDWWKDIEKGIEEADTFVFLISPDSAKSGVCGREIDCAVKNGKRLIPIVVRDVKGEEAPPQLTHLNWIFLRESDDFGAALQKLLAGIHTDFEWVERHRWIQNRALDWQRGNKDRGALLRGKDLEEAEFQLATNTSKEPHPTDLQREYVFESRKAAERQRRITIGISVAAIVALAALAVFGFYQAKVATDREKIARSGELIAQSIEIRDRDFQVSLLLGVAGYHSADTVQSRSVLLNALNGNPLIQYLSGHQGEVNVIAYSPDKSIFASGSDDRTIILWNATTHQPIGQPLVGHKGAVTQLVFSSAGKILVSASCEKDSLGQWVDECTAGEIILWDVEKQQPIGQTLRGYHLFYNVVAINPEADLLAFLNAPATSGGNPSIVLWDIRKNRQLGQVIYPDGNTTAISFSPDGRSLASYVENTITLWDVTSQARLDSFPTESQVSKMIFMDDSILTLALGSRAPVAWDIHTHTASEFSPRDSHNSVITSAAVSADGSLLATGMLTPGMGGVDYSSIAFWDAERLSQIGEERLTGHRMSVDTIAFSQDGKTLAFEFEGLNNAIVLWNVDVAMEPADGGSAYPPLGQYLLTPHPEQANEDSLDYRQIKFDSTGKYLAIGGGNNKIGLWSSQTQALSEHVLTGQEFSFSKDGRYLASGDENGITLWDVTTQQAAGPRIQIKETSALAFSPDGKTLISGHHGGAGVLLWKISDVLRSGEATVQVMSRSFGNSSGMDISGLAVSPNGKLLAAGSDTQVTLWNLNSQQRLKTFSGHSFEVTDLVFSSDGNVLASGDGVNVFIWDVGKKEQISTSFYGFGFALSPDGKFLVTLNADLPGTSQETVWMTVWEIATRRSIGNPLRGNNAELITSLSFSPDGNTLASMSIDGSVILWNMNPESWAEQACQHAGRNFTSDELTLYFPGKDYPTEQKDATCPQWPLDAGVIPIQTPTP